MIWAWDSYGFVWERECRSHSHVVLCMEYRADGTGGIDGTRIENWCSTRKTMKNTRKDKAKEGKR